MHPPDRFLSWAALATLVLVLVSCSGGPSARSAPVDLSSPESISAVQARLQALGYPVRSIDGQRGPETRAAIRLFQKENGYSPRDGAISRRLHELLMSERAVALPAIGAEGVFGIPVQRVREYCATAADVEAKALCIATMSIYSSQRRRMVESLAIPYPPSQFDFSCDQTFLDLERDVADTLWRGRSARIERGRFLAIGQGSCDVPARVHELLFSHRIDLSACDVAFGDYATVSGCIEAITREYGETNRERMRSALLEKYATADNSVAGLSRAYEVQGRTALESIVRSLEQDMHGCNQRLKTQQPGTQASRQARNLQGILKSGSALNGPSADGKRRAGTFDRDRPRIDCGIAARLLDELAGDPKKLGERYAMFDEQARDQQCDASRVTAGPGASDARSALNEWLAQNCSVSGFARLIAEDAAAGRINRGSPVGLGAFNFDGSGDRCVISSSVFPTVFMLAAGTPRVITRNERATGNYRTVVDAPIDCGSNGTPGENALACHQFAFSTRRYAVTSRWDEASCRWQTLSVDRQVK